MPHPSWRCSNILHVSSIVVWLRTLLITSTVFERQVVTAKITLYWNRLPCSWHSEIIIYRSSLSLFHCNKSSIKVFIVYFIRTREMQLLMQISLNFWNSGQFFFSGIEMFTSCESQLICNYTKPSLYYAIRQSSNIWGVPNPWDQVHSITIEMISFL